MTATEQAIKERPILMKPELVRATLEGRKTVTRRVIKDQPVHIPAYLAYTGGREMWATESGYSWYGGEAPPQCYLDTCPQGRPGERIWIKETFWQYGRYIRHGKGWGFVARDPKPHASILFNCPGPKTPRDQLGYHKRPSLFMERWMSRATVEITGVRVERVQDISEADAQAEGIDRGPADHPDGQWYGAGCVSAVAAFRELWDQINGPRGFGWDANPWCWVIEYRLLDNR